MAYSSHSEAVANSWFSRRNKTAEKFHAWQASRDAKHADKAKREQERILAAAKRTPQEQIKRLDFTLGPGVGAVRERKRLNALLGK